MFKILCVCSAATWCVKIQTGTGAGLYKNLWEQRLTMSEKARTMHKQKFSFGYQVA